MSQRAIEHVTSSMMYVTTGHDNMKNSAIILV